jgi:hypothetical protein
LKAEQEKIIAAMSAPFISNVSSNSPSETGAVITWDTDEDTNSQIVYGLTSSYGSSSTLDTATTTSHSVSLSELQPDTLYNYAVISTNSSGYTATSSNQTLTTDSTPTITTTPNPTFTRRSGSRVRTKNIPSTLSTKETVATTPMPVTNFTFTRDLQKDTIGDDVKALQKFLNDKGYTVALVGAGSPGNETNYFGTLTRSALIEFQKANNILPSVGYFGPITKAFIKSH